MRRAVTALSAIVVATIMACVSVVFGADALRAAPSPPEGGSTPSQGSFTTGKATANEPSLVADTPPSISEGDERVFSASGRATRKDVLRAARRHLGTSYRYATCTTKRMSCTCLTKRTWSRFGNKLPMAEKGQWSYKPSRKIAKSNLRPGDIVFFKEAGKNKPITHVGIYSGKGNIVHASAYFGKVVESKMKYVKGYSGAKRLRLR